jgi:arginine utilization protein RocB
VRTYTLAELDSPPSPISTGEASLQQARAHALEIVRRRAAELPRPSVVLFLLPPYYPAASPRDSAVARAARTVGDAEGLSMLGRYPYISDASYVAWRSETPSEIARHLPGLGGAYRVPQEDAAALDLDVVNLGPWGRGAHGLYERVHAPYAFGKLPELIRDVAVEACRAPEQS